MKNAIVYSSVSGNTKKLAEQIEKTLGGAAYVGKPSDEALDSDVLYVGFWTAKFTCTPDIAGFLEKLNGKKVFLFGTAGYDNMQAYYDGILDSVAAHLNASNEVIGRFMTQAKVSAAKKAALEKADPAKFAAMQAKLAQGESRPNADDLAKLAALVKA